MNDDLIFSVSDFVAVLNQTLEYAYPSVMVQGELANFRVSKNRWVYFDLKDEFSSVKFFGTIYQLPGPLEDGMLLQVRGLPRLHQLYGFSVNVQLMQPVGEGSIKRASELLQAKLELEGLFDPARKRPLPHPPKRIGLIASGESAAYHDFIKILNERWSGVEVMHADVQVQGEKAPGQIIAALDYLNSHADVEVIVITRGGGSAEDLAAFSTEQVTRAVSASRTPTIVAIGHEVDISLAELAADQRASTPSNAAQLLVPDKRYELTKLAETRQNLYQQVRQGYEARTTIHKELRSELTSVIERTLSDEGRNLHLQKQLLGALSPSAALMRGYTIVRSGGKPIVSADMLKKGQAVTLQFYDGQAVATVSSIN
jgi:exodeoxyribonuclease VII large subunit